MSLGDVRSCVLSDWTKIASIMSYKFQAMKQIKCSNIKPHINHPSRQQNADVECKIPPNGNTKQVIKPYVE